MASIVVSNSSDDWLVVWLEPLGEDRWLRPGERFTIHDNHDGPNTPFEIVYWASDDDRAAGIENLTVWINEGDPFTTEVHDRSGAVVECGHQRPPEVDQKWSAAAHATEERLRNRNPEEPSA